MKSTFYFNLVCYLIVIIAYISSYIYGAIFQLFLGCIQLTFATLIYKDSRKTKNRFSLKLLSIYGYSIIICLIIYIVLANFTETKELHTLFPFIIPMLIGLYFVLLTFLTRKQ